MSVLPNLAAHPSGVEQMSSSRAVRHVARHSALDQKLHGRVARSPSRDVQRAAILRDAPIAVALLEQCPDLHAEIEKSPNAVGIPIAGELREQLASLRLDFADELRFALQCPVPKAGLDESRPWIG